MKPNIQFLCASGILAMNAAAVTEVREFEFFLDPGEIDNGLDDDGDGLVDEGRLEFRDGTTRVTLARDLETCTFEILAKTVEVGLQIARTDSNQRVHRMFFRHKFFPRNG